MKNNIPTQSPQPLQYAGFWLRLLALMLDGMILSASEFLLVGLLHILGTLWFSGKLPVIAELVFCLISAFVPWPYFILFESSQFQATPGKLAFGLQVTDLAGQRLSKLRALTKMASHYLVYLISFLAFLFFASLAVVAANLLKGAAPALISVLKGWEWAFMLLGFLAYNLGYVACFCLLLFSERKQTLFDKITGRLVIKKPPKAILLSLKDQKIS